MAAKILEVEALGVERIGDGSTEHGAILTLVQRPRHKAAGSLRRRLGPFTTRLARAASVADQRPVTDPATHNCTRRPGILHFSYSRPRDLGVRPRGIGIRLRATRQRGSRPRAR